MISNMLKGRRRFFKIPWKNSYLLPVVLVGFTILLINAIVSNHLADVSDRFLTSVVSEQELKSLLNELRLAAFDIESNHNAYLLSGSDVFLIPYNTALDEMPALQARVKKQTFNDPGISKKARLLEAQLYALTEESKKQIKAFEAAGKNADISSIDEFSIAEIRVDIDNLIDSMRTWQTALIANGIEGSKDTSQLSRWINYLTVGLLCLLAGVTAAGVKQYVGDLDNARDELRSLNSNLESQVNERSGEIVRANNEIRRFAYIVSHDLRAPLVNIMGFTSELNVIGQQLKKQYEIVAEKAPELLLPDSGVYANEDLPEAIGFINASTTKMDRLINSILRLSREGQRKLVPVEVDMTVMIEGIVDSVTQQLDAANASIEVEDLPNLTTDELSVEQIFSNMIENAVKYLDPARDGKITVRGRIEGPQSVFQVIDNGRGIDEEDITRIFELFRRAGVQNTEGEGVGLAFVQAQVRRLGGTIRVESVLNEGSEFTLRFPRTLIVQS